MKAIFVCAYALALAAALCVCAVPPCYGQAVAIAEIDGQVTDASGAGIPGAAVKVTQANTGFSRAALTDQQGRYGLPNLPVGPYSLEVQASGFKTYSQSGILLQVGNNVQINVPLQVGAVNESVEVKADAGMVETRDNAVSQVIDQQRIVDLPLNGRQATQLILISGAATTAPNGDLTGSKNFYSSINISVAGGQANGTNYLLDGGDNNDTFSNVNLPFPFPDALQEFSVETSSLPARNGLHPGAAVNVVTKSGTNSWHGDLFEFLRNGDVNARNFLAPRHDTLKRNQFGGTLGGRIVRDKVFFFVGYQGTRNRQDPPSTTAFVPTTAALSGDFSAIESAACQSSKKVRTIVDPSTGQPFPNAQVPVALFNPASVALAKYLPVSNDPCGRVVYGIPSTGDEDQVVGRVDWIKSSRQTIFGRYFVADFSNPAGWNPTNILVTTQPGNLERAQTFTFGDTFTFSPNTLNSFHATFSRRRDDRGPSASSINVTKLGVNLSIAVPNDLRISVPNAFNIGCGTCAPGFFNVNTFQFADDVDLMRGRHQIALGIDLIRTQNNTLSGYLQNGNFTFGGQYSGDPLVDFMLGALSQSGTSSAFSQSRSQQVALRETVPGFYAQDTIKLNSRLTLNAGLRWEPMLFPQDFFGRGSVFDPSAFDAGQHSRVFTNAPAGMFYYGDPGVSKSFTHNKWLNLSPRLGIVWDPQGNGRQTIRAGGAILYDSGMVWFSQRLMSNPPFVNQIDLTTAGPFDNPWLGYPGGNPFPGVVPPPSDVAFPTQAFYALLPQNLKPMRTAQWNVSYQRQIAGDWLASATYLGNKTTHVWLTQNINPALYIPGTCGGKPCSTTANNAQRRVYYMLNPAEGQYFGAMDLADDGGNSNYNGLLLSVQHRFSKGFTALANYTWSHCISEGDFNGDLRGSYYQDPFNRIADRGDCNYDIRHIFNASFVALTPVMHGMAGHLLGNWQIAPLLRVASGLPLNLSTGKDNSLTGEGLDRPNLVPGVSPYAAEMGPSLTWLNPAAFAPNPTGTFGNLGRDVLRGPRTVNFDLALSRLFAVTERYRLEARAEAFNAINHTNFNAITNTVLGVNFTGITTNLSSANFGRIQSAADPRILQFALKVHF